MDDTEEIRLVFDAVINDYPDDFEFLAKYAKFQFTFREKPTYDEDGQPIAATAMRLSNRERDLYGADFEICCHKETWDYYNEDMKERLIFHELLHCQVAHDEEDEEIPAYDNDGRVYIYCVPHDIITKTFKREIEEFGLVGSDLDVASFMHKQYELHTSKKTAKKRRKR